MTWTAGMKDLVDDVVLCIASFGDAADLRNIALTCRRYGSAGPAVGAASLAERAARARVAAASDDERARVPGTGARPPSWMTLYRELLLLRRPPAFDRILGRGIAHVNRNKSHVYVSLQEEPRRPPLREARHSLRFRPRAPAEGGAGLRVSCAAVGNHVMRAGRHYVRFTMTRVDRISFGIIRPLRTCVYDDTRLGEGFCPLALSAPPRKSSWGAGDVHCCLYATYPGSCQWTDWRTTTQTVENWRGMEHALEGDVGLLLDLEEGTLAVYKHDRRLGVIKDGLTGEYCWLMSIQGACNPTAIMIRRGRMPMEPENFSFRVTHI